jgi:acyl-CoA reductase-like NAD-dependent aldehyde dehydrogenase
MLEIIDPTTERVLAELEEHSPERLREQVVAARRAQREWARIPLGERAAAIERFGSLVADRGEQLAALLTAEVGKPIVQARSELASLQDRLTYFIASTPLAVADELVHAEAGLEERIRYEPLGVVANVSAWNYPYFVGANVFVPALLTGNAVLYKPSELASLTGLRIAVLLREAGVPEAVFVPVIGAGGVGSALVEQPVDGIFFTGSHATGQRIARAAAGRMIPLQLELGGKDPVYVCEDVDVATAAAAVAEGAFYNAGQSCCAVERVYVHRRIAEPFLEAFVAAVAAYPVGDPTDERTYIGPLARREQLAVLEAQVADARRLGARLLCGGERRPGPGFFFEPTVLADVDHRMRVMREESFGPLIGVQVVEGDEEAASLMADTEYGLTAGVFTRERSRAEAILARLEVGSAYWNCCDRVSPRLPWSGRRNSGIGTTLSTAGIRAFVRPKAWHLREPQ